MRCCSCGANLNDFESTRKLESTGDYLDMCNDCYKDIEYDVPTTVRSDLNPNEYIVEEEEFIDEADVWLFDNDPDRE